MFVERVSKPYSGWPGLDRREAPVLPAVELSQGPGLRKDSNPGHPSETSFETTSASSPQHPVQYARGRAGLLILKPLNNHESNRHIHIFSLCSLFLDGPEKSRQKLFPDGFFRILLRDRRDLADLSPHHPPVADVHADPITPDIAGDGECRHTGHRASPTGCARELMAGTLPLSNR